MDIARLYVKSLVEEEQHGIFREIADEHARTVARFSADRRIQPDRGEAPSCNAPSRSALTIFAGPLPPGRTARKAPFRLRGTRVTTRTAHYSQRDRRRTAQYRLTLGRRMTASGCDREPASGGQSKLEVDLETTKGGRKGRSS